MLIEAGRLKFYISLSFAVFFAIAANTAEGRSYVLMMICALLHESVHIILLFICGCKSILLKFSPGGIGMESEGFELLSYKKTVLCTLVPPALNIAAGGIFYLLYYFIGYRTVYELSVINFVLGIGNILPFSFLDGGRALGAALCEMFTPEKARKICDIISLIVLLLLSVLFFITLIMGKYFLFIVFFFFYCVSGYISEKTKGGIT